MEFSNGWSLQVRNSRTVGLLKCEFFSNGWAPQVWNFRTVGLLKRWAPQPSSVEFSNGWALQVWNCRTVGLLKRGFFFNCWAPHVWNFRTVGLLKRGIFEWLGSSCVEFWVRTMILSRTSVLGLANRNVGRVGLRERMPSTSCFG